MTPRSGRRTAASRSSGFDPTQHRGFRTQATSCGFGAGSSGNPWLLVPTSGIVATPNPKISCPSIEYATYFQVPGYESQETLSLESPGGVSRDARRKSAKKIFNIADDPCYDSHSRPNTISEPRPSTVHFYVYVVRLLVLIALEFPTARDPSKAQIPPLTRSQIPSMKSKTGSILACLVVSSAMGRAYTGVQPT